MRRRRPLADGFSGGSTPSSCDRWKCRRVPVAVNRRPRRYRRWRSCPHVGEHADEFQLLPEPPERLLGPDLTVYLLVGGRSPTYSPSAIENALASSPATPESTTVRVGAATATPAIRAGVADQPVHRPNVAVTGSQPPGDVGMGNSGRGSVMCWWWCTA